MPIASFVVFCLLNFLRWFVMGWGWSDGNMANAPVDLLTSLTFVSFVYVFFYTMKRPKLLAKLSGKRRLIYLWFPSIAMILSVFYNAGFDDLTASRILVVLPYAMLVVFDLVKKPLLGIKQL